METATAARGADWQEIERYINSCDSDVDDEEDDDDGRLHGHLEAFDGNNLRQCGAHFLNGLFACWALKGLVVSV